MPKLSKLMDLVRIAPTGTNCSSAATLAFDLEWDRSINFTILGHLPSMKNSRRILKNRRTGRTFSAKSSEATKYVSDFIAQVSTYGFGSEPLHGPVKTHVSVWYRSERSDLDCALVYDCLQLAGVIENDRQVVEKHEFRHIDRENPRVEIRIEEIR